MSEKETSLETIITNYVDAVRVLAQITSKKEISGEELACADAVIGLFKDEFGEEMLAV